MPPCGKGGDKRQWQGNGAEGTPCSGQQCERELASSWVGMQGCMGLLWGETTGKLQQPKQAVPSLKAIPSPRQKAMPTVFGLQSHLGIEACTQQCRASDNTVLYFPKCFTRHLMWKRVLYEAISK